MNPVPRISEAEWQVMKVVWQQPGCSAQAVIERLSASQQWGPATIKTLLNRLIRKQALHFEKAGKSYLYSAAFSEEECRKAESQSFLHRVFDGALLPMIAHFVRSNRLSEKELAELETLLRQRRTKK